MDDLDGRKLCAALHLRRTGTAGVLYEAARSGLIDFQYAIGRLQSTSFRLRASVVEELCRRLQRAED